MSQTKRIDCPMCGADMEVAWYYYESDPNEAPYVDWEVYVNNADCDCELTPKQEEALLKDLMEDAADAAASRYEDADDY